MNQTRTPIIVGVNDTEAGRAALSFAMHEAAKRGSPLDVVTVWTARNVVGSHQAIGDDECDRAEAQDLQDLAVAGALRAIGAAPTLSRQVVEGDAATVLLALARTADYLVVGAGRGIFDANSALGSVTEQCVRAAGCPVLVVPRPSLRSAKLESTKEG